MRRFAKTLSILLAVLMLMQVSVFAGVTEQAHSVSATDETIIDANLYSQASEGVTENATTGSVTVPAGGTVTYKLNITNENAGIYRIWLIYGSAAGTSGGGSVSLSGATEIDQVTIAKDITSEAGRKTNIASANYSKLINMGRYDLQPQAGGKELTFKLADNASKPMEIVDVRIKRVGGHKITTSAGGHKIAVSDYLYGLTSNGMDESWSLVNRITASMVGYTPGVLMGQVNTQYTTYKLDVEQAGIYKITEFSQNAAVGDKVTLQAATTTAGLADANVYTITKTAAESGEATFVFSNIKLAAGTNYVTIGVTNPSGNRYYGGFEVKYKGEELAITEAKAGQTTLTNNYVIENPDEVTSFEITFGREINPLSATTETVYLEKVVLDEATKQTGHTVTPGVNKVTLTGVALENNSTYRLCVNGVADTQGIGVDDYALTFTTTGLTTISATEETVVDVTKYNASTGDVTVDGAKVVVPAQGTVSYTLKVAESGIYRIWAFHDGTTYGSKLSMTGAQEIPADVTLSTGVKSQAGRKSTASNVYSKVYNMGRYTLTGGSEPVTLTFTTTAATALTKISIKKVDAIEIPASGVAKISISEYLHTSNMGAPQFDAFIVDTTASRFPVALSGSYGNVLGGASTQWTTHAIKVPSDGVYAIKGYGRTGKEKTSEMTLQTGTSVEAAAAVPLVAGKNQLSYTNTGSMVDTEYDFGGVVLKQGINYITRSMTGDGCYFAGFTVERIGDLLTLNSVKANTAGTAFAANGNVVTAGTDTFKLTFSRDVLKDTVNENTVYIMQGETKIPLNFTYDENGSTNVYASLKNVLIKNTEYVLYVDGVSDAYGSSVDREYRFSTNAVDEGTSSISITSATNEYRNVTIQGKMLTSRGTGIQGRNVVVTLGGDSWNVTSGVDGAFTLNCEIPAGSDSDDYTFTVSGTYIVSGTPVVITYITEGDEAIILGELAAASDAAAVESFVNTHAGTLKVNPEADMPNAPFDKSFVYAQLTNLQVEKATDFKTAYQKAILLETINQADSADDVAPIFADADKCDLLGIDKAITDYIADEQTNFLNAVAALNVRAADKSLQEELSAVADALGAQINESLKAEYEKQNATLKAQGGSYSCYVNQEFSVNLDLVEAQTNLSKVTYIFTSTSPEMFAEADVDTTYNYTKTLVGNTLTVVVDLAANQAARSTAIGTVKLAAPATAGTYSVDISGKMSFDEGVVGTNQEKYLITTDITGTTVSVTAGSAPQSPSPGYTSTPMGSSKPEPIEPPKADDPEIIEPNPDGIVSNFNDLSGCEWAVEAINHLYDRGIISDNEEKKFRPTDNVTREEFVKMIIEALDLVHKDYDTDLKDVKSGTWYYPYIATAVEKGIISGDDKGYFRVGESIQRQDMAVIIIRVLDKFGHPYELSSEPFADDAQIAEYAKNAMYAAKNLAIINGVGDNMCQPKGTATRAMAAKVIYEMMRTVGIR